MMVSPEATSEMACLIVLQGVVGDVQLLLSLPLTPFTYHVVLAQALEARARNIAANRKLVSSLSFMIFSFSSRQVR
jgi:hypothetical protein